MWESETDFNETKRISNNGNFSGFLKICFFFHWNLQQATTLNKKGKQSSNSSNQNMTANDAPTTSGASATSECPTTSTAATKTFTATTPTNTTPSSLVSVLKLSPRKFRKFLDEKFPRTKKSRLQKIAANNLRRKFKQAGSPRNYAAELREKLQNNEETQTSSKRRNRNRKRRLKLNESPGPAANGTIEDGEIISELEDDSTLTASKAVAENDDDDTDCMIVEQPIEEITIPDDEPSIASIDCSNLGFNSFVAERLQTEKNCTSTPNMRRVQSPIAAELKAENGVENNLVPNDERRNNEEDVDNDAIETLPFFVDTTACYPPNENVAEYAAENAADSSRKNGRRLSKRRLRHSHGNLPPIPGEEIIILDDSTDETLQSTKKRRKSCNDSSVIFVSETNPNESPFIPLTSDKVPNPLPKNSSPLWSRRLPLSRRDDLFTSMERKQLKVYNENTYNPNPAPEPKKNQKRTIVIDGSNVAYSHGRSKCFSVKGLKIAIEYFEKMGHQVKCVVPLFRQNPFQSTEPEELQRLYGDGKIIFTPCKNLPGRSSSSYDDRFILQIASELDAAIISNDNYRDLITENEAFKKLIENRVVGYTWCDDMFMLPKDPYGRNGPNLHVILNCR